MIKCSYCLHPHVISQCNCGCHYANAYANPVKDWLRTIGWGILFAMPFIVMCIMVAVIYR